MKKSSKIKSLKSFFGLYETLFPEKMSSGVVGAATSNSLTGNSLLLRKDEEEECVAKTIMTSTAEHSHVVTNSISNRWPSSLPMAKHNIYWLKPSTSPCLCLGLDQASLRTPTEPLVRIIPICTETYHHETKVFLANLESFSLKEHEGLCQDSRSIDFAKALMMFCEWELQDKPNCVWYSYPSFVKDFLKHPPTWSTWRSRAERAFRGQKEGREIVYFNALKDELQLRPFDDRGNGLDFPWDDTAILRVEENQRESTDDDSVDSPVSRGKSSQSRSKTDGAKEESDEASSTESENTKENASRLRLAKKEDEQLKKIAAKLAKEIKLKEKEEAERQKEIDRRKDFLNSLSPKSMYWISKSKLPAICIQHTRVFDGSLPSWKLTLKPICCSTYHYCFEIEREKIEVLTENHLRECDDERTADFTYALMRFFDEHKDGYSTEVSTLASDMEENIDEVFVWPGYVIDLMEEYREWSVWRKNAERETYGKRDLRRASYLKVMLGEFRELEIKLAADIAQDAFVHKTSVGDISFNTVVGSKRSRDENDTVELVDDSSSDEL